MSNMFNDKHRDLQDEFDSRNLADGLVGLIVHDTLTEEDTAFIHARNMFFLSTIDHEGRPTVSYKGGDKGFVKSVDGGKALIFPSYDGNGMFLSMGNIQGNNKVGLLFIDFENPYRLRIYGLASVLKQEDAPELFADYPEAELLVKVQLTEIWQNCPRYIHKHKMLEQSEFVPQANKPTPPATWKRLDLVQPVLAAKDQGKAEQAGGVISMEELMEIEKRDD